MSESRELSRAIKEFISDNSPYNVQVVKPLHLMDLITIFCWLDEEHQSRAVSALNWILQDQMTEKKAI